MYKFSHHAFRYSDNEKKYINFNVGNMKPENDATAILFGYRLESCPNGDRCRIYTVLFILVHVDVF